MPLGLTRRNSSIFLNSVTVSSAFTIGTGQTSYGFQVSTFTTQFGAISSGQILEVTLTTSVSGALLGDLVHIEGRPITAGSECALTGWRLSTVATSNITLVISNPGSTISSTGRITGSIAYIDLTP